VRYPRLHDTDEPPPDMLPALRFGHDDAVLAHERFGFECGAAALCAVLEETPENVRRYLIYSETQRYTNPTAMTAVLTVMRVPHRITFRSDDPQPKKPLSLRLGVARVQWGGHWCGPHMPLAARRRKTHWIAVCGDWVYDINRADDGWIHREVWERFVLPAVAMDSCGSDWDGTWWFTHGYELEA
jgi:hypothetical protein